MGDYPGSLRWAQWNHKALYKGKETEPGKQMSERDLKMLAAGFEDG